MLGRLLTPFGYVTNEELGDALHHALEIAQRYSGTIFACAELGGASEFNEGISPQPHFRNPMFAPLARVHVFESPLAPEDVEQCVRIHRGGAITIIGKHDFDKIRSQLALVNRMPDFLSTVEFTDHGFRRVNQDNWPMISCAAGTRFRVEAQVRSYLLDYLLNEVKDANTPLLRECVCLRNGTTTGTVDYFVCIAGRWIPIEAKVSVLTVADIASQIERYINIDGFTPTVGSVRKTIATDPDSALCLVGDQFGLYITQNGSLHRCLPGHPVWPRERMSHETAAVVRQRLQTLS